MKIRLPPLPGSDKQSLTEDKADSFYEKKPSEVWRGEINQVTVRTASDSRQCKHYFELVKAKEIKCQKCGLGLFIETGDEIKEGHLYSQGKLIA